MNRNSWKARLLFGCAIWLADVAHSNLVQHVSNTPEGMLVYHGSAALFDLLLLACASFTLKGDLLDDLQNLCLLSIIVNFVGWILYTAWLPPLIYNSAILGVGSVQYIRLLLAGIHVDHLGNYLVRSDHHGRTEFHFRKKTQ